MLREIPATAKGLVLHGRGFPTRCQPGPRVVGDLITIRPVLYSEVLADVDQLEGYHPSWPGAYHFIRAARSVVATNRTQTVALGRHSTRRGSTSPDLRSTPTRMPRITDDRLAPLTATHLPHIITHRQNRRGQLAMCPLRNHSPLCYPRELRTIAATGGSPP